jgi:hypothetical protein
VLHRRTLVIAALTMGLACSLSAQVPLRPPPDTTRRPTWPGATAVAARPRHSHPWLGAAIGAVAGGAFGCAVWRPCSGWWCFTPSRGATTATGAAGGALLGWAIGSSITAAARARVAAPWRYAPPLPRYHSTVAREERR